MITLFKSNSIQTIFLFVTKTESESMMEDLFTLIKSNN